MVKLSPYPISPDRASYLPFSSVLSARLAGSSAWDPSVVVAMALVGWRDLFRDQRLLWLWQYPKCGRNLSWLGSVHNLSSPDSSNGSGDYHVVNFYKLQKQSITLQYVSGEMNEKFSPIYWDEMNAANRLQCRKIKRMVYLQILICLSECVSLNKINDYLK